MSIWRFRPFTSLPPYVSASWPLAIKQVYPNLHLILCTKHDAIDTADPSSIQDTCHVNFAIGMSHRRVSVARKVRYNSLFLSNEDYLIV